MGAKKRSLGKWREKSYMWSTIRVSASCEFLKHGVKMNLRMPLEIIPPLENIREFPVGL